LTIGTVECLTVAFDRAITSPVLRQANLCTYSHTATGLYATLAYHLTGGNLLRWFREEWGGGKMGSLPQEVDGYHYLLSQMPEGPSRLLALPYFTSSGTPYFDAVTPGVIVGLRLTTRSGEVLLALLEGLAFELKLNISLMEDAGILVDELYCVGGGARSDVWLQLIADVLDRSVLRPHIIEAGCRGAAALACSSITNRQPAEIIREWKIETRKFTPNPVKAGQYASRFPLYQDLYRRLANFVVPSIQG
jgi:xylulokinase